MKNQGIPPEVIEKLKDSLDCDLYFFGSHVNIGTMYIILGITIFVLIGIYVLLNKSKKIQQLMLSLPPLWVTAARKKRFVPHCDTNLFLTVSNQIATPRGNYA